MIIHDAHGDNILVYLTLTILRSLSTIKEQAVFSFYKTGFPRSTIRRYAYVYDRCNSAHHSHCVLGASGAAEPEGSTDVGAHCSGARGVCGH